MVLLRAAAAEANTRAPAPSKPVEAESTTNLYDSPPPWEDPGIAS